MDRRQGKHIVASHLSKQFVARKRLSELKGRAGYEKTFWGQEIPYVFSVAFCGDRVGCMECFQSKCVVAWKLSEWLSVPCFREAAAT